MLGRERSIRERPRRARSDRLFRNARYPRITMTEDGPLPPRTAPGATGARSQGGRSWAVPAHARTSAHRHGVPPARQTLTPTPPRQRTSPRTGSRQRIGAPRAPSPAGVALGQGAAGADAAPAHRGLQARSTSRDAAAVRGSAERARCRREARVPRGARCLPGTISGGGSRPGRGTLPPRDPVLDWDPEEPWSPGAARNGQQPRNDSAARERPGQPGGAGQAWRERSLTGPLIKLADDDRADRQAGRRRGCPPCTRGSAASSGASCPCSW